MKILIFLLLFLTTPVKASEDTVSLIKVSDGDTIKVLLNGEKESIRLLDIDCYETSKNKRAHWQSKYYHLPMGEVIKKGKYSKEKLQNILNSQDKLTLKWKKRDRYKRILGNVYLSDGTEISHYMLQKGGCERYIEKNIKLSKNIKKL